MIINKFILLLLFNLLIFKIKHNEANETNFNIGGLIPEFGVNNAFKKMNTIATNKTIDNDGVLHDKSITFYNKKLSVGVTPTIMYASEILNQQFRRYYNCNVKFDIKDTHCDVAYGTKSFFDLANDTKRTLMIFGGSCDTTIQPIAESVQFFNLTILSYTETNPQFSDTSKYNGFYRLVPSDEQHNYLRIHLIRRYKWKRIGTIYLTKAKYTLTHNMLLRELENRNLVNQTITRSVVDKKNLNEQYETILNEFKQNDIKIIIGIFDIKSTIHLFCQIYKMNMYGANYQWIILGAYNKNVLFTDNTEKNCTNEELIIALNGTLQTRVVEYSYNYESVYKSVNLYKPQSSEILQMRSNDLISSLRDLYIHDYYRKCLTSVNRTKRNHNCPYSYFHGYAFDSLLAIFKLLSTLIENNHFTCDYNTFSRNIDWYKLINLYFSKISFKGVTGHVAFLNGSRIGQIKLEQLRAINKNSSSSSHVYKLDLNEVLISVHDQSENLFYHMNEISWHNNQPPTDRTIKVKYLYRIYTGIFLGMSALASIGILMSFGFLIFNIKYRQHRFIKMSSPYLNNLIVFGCLLSYINIYFLGLYEGLVPKKMLDHICAIRVWLISVGFTLAFGSMFSKTYRVHAILTNTKLRKKVIKDYKLFGIVIFLLIFDIIILLVWQIIDPLKIVRKPVDDFELRESNIVAEENVCESKNATIWIIILFSYKGLLIIFGCFFAYETRHVSISALNDSKHIGMCVYNVLIMCGAGSAIAFIVRNRNIAFILITLFIFLCTTITLILVFVPKVLEVRKDPTGAKKPKAKATFKRTSIKNAYNNNSKNESEERKINALMLEIKEKREILIKTNAKIDTLMKQIGDTTCLSTSYANLDLLPANNTIQSFCQTSETFIEATLENKKTSSDDEDEENDENTFSISSSSETNHENESVKANGLEKEKKKIPLIRITTSFDGNGMDSLNPSDSNNLKRITSELFVNFSSGIEKKFQSFKGKIKAEPAKNGDDPTSENSPTRNRSHSLLPNFRKSNEINWI